MLRLLFATSDAVLDNYLSRIYDIGIMDIVDFVELNLASLQHVSSILLAALRAC